MRPFITIAAVTLTALTVAAPRAWAFGNSDLFVLNMNDPQHTMLTNITDEAIPVVGISFETSLGGMDPESYVSFSARVDGAAEGPMWVMENFGVPGLSMGILRASSTAITEVTLGDDPLWPAGLTMDFGAFASAVASYPPCSGRLVIATRDLDTSGPSDRVEMCFPPAPEPATMSLLGAGALAMLRRRRR